MYAIRSYYVMNGQVPALKTIVYKQMKTRFDAEYGALWCIMDPKPRPCINSELLEDFHVITSYSIHYTKLYE